jgi:hypothetical protein
MAILGAIFVRTVAAVLVRVNTEKRRGGRRRTKAVGALCSWEDVGCESSLHVPPRSFW